MEKPKYNKTLAPLYKAKHSEVLYSIPVKPDMFDALQEVKVGGRLFVKKAPSKKGPKSPDFYLEYATPESVAEFEAKLASRKDEEDSL